MANTTNLTPPITIEEFTCAGNGLLYEGHARESPTQLRALVLPKGDRNGIGDRDRPKSWWLAQNKFYGLARAKATSIGTLRSKLEDALRARGGMKVPERVLSLEVEGNGRYLELAQQQTAKGKKRPAKASSSKDKGASWTSTNMAPTSASKTAARSSRVKWIRVPRTENTDKPTARKLAGGLAKRSRSPSTLDGPRKRIHTNGGDGEFEWLTGFYLITEAEVLKGWENWKFEDLKLVIRLDSNKRLSATFNFYVVQGVMRSSTNILSRADGATAKIEWCGEEGEDATGAMFPPTEEMKGTLRFTRNMHDGRDVVKGVIEYVEAIGTDIEFTAERTGKVKGLRINWEEYSWEEAEAKSAAWARICERYCS